VLSRKVFEILDAVFLRNKLRCSRDVQTLLDVAKQLDKPVKPVRLSPRAPAVLSL